MKRRILATMLVGVMILGLVACGTKETEKPADDPNVAVKDETTETVEDVIENVEKITDENYNEIMSEHGIEITGTLIEEIDSTEDDPEAQCFVLEDGTEKYVRQVYTYVDADGNEYEAVPGYKNENHEDIFFDHAMKAADGTIYAAAINNGFDEETKTVSLVVVEENLYVAYLDYQLEKFLAENPVEEVPADDTAETEETAE